MSPPDACRPPSEDEGQARNEIDGGVTIDQNDITGWNVSHEVLARYGIEPDAVDQASDDDRAYFDGHPDETERVRLALPGEFGPYVAWVQVRQIRPGVRTRAPWVAAA